MPGVGKSHPHGCVSWNIWSNLSSPRVIRHTLTGVWVEIWCNYSWFTPIMSHPHGCVSWNLLCPQRIHDRWSHTLTGVWVEIKSAFISSPLFKSHPHGCVSWNWTRSIPQAFWSYRHTLTGVWVEIRCTRYGSDETHGHTLTGVWVEISITALLIVIWEVTPSRVCELKCQYVE